jgi:hypothetical protein
MVLHAANHHDTVQNWLMRRPEPQGKANLRKTKKQIDEGSEKGVTMSLRRVCFFATLYLLCGATSLSAQYRESDHVHFEISPFGGSRFGGVVQLNPNPSNINYFTIKSSWDYGVLGDVSLLPTLQAEFMWNRQPTELGAHNFFTGTTSQHVKIRLKPLIGRLDYFRVARHPPTSSK